MAPPMASPPPMGPDPMMMQTEAQFENMGERLAQDTLANINQAEDIEGAINGLRGNEKPIEARYDELAGFVGQNDAKQTPESVLAMVQPTIMMTEQGAMDSGIGELIQGLAGSEMETPMGEPTAMGQGVGELMAMGAGNTPPVNFNQGGPVEVRRYAPGGIVEKATALKDELLPLYQQIYGSEADKQAELDEIKRMQRGQASLDLAKFGLALASPTDQPMSFAEKLAVAGQPLATSIQQRGDVVQKAALAQRGEGKQAQASALTAALGQVQREEERKADLAQQEAKAKATAQASFLKTKIGENYQIIGKNGEVLWQGPIANIGQQKVLMEQFPNATTFEKVMELKAFAPITFVNPNDPTDIVIIDKNNVSKENKERIASITQETNANGTPKYFESGSIPDPRKVDLQMVVNKNDPNDKRYFDLNDPDQLILFNELPSNYIPINTLSMKDLVEDPTSLGNSYTANFIKITSNPVTLEQYAANTLDPAIANVINAFITNETVEKPNFDANGQVSGMAPGFNLSPTLLEAIAARSEIEGASLPVIGGLPEGKVTVGNMDRVVFNDEGPRDRVVFDDEGNIDFSGFEGQSTFIITGLDLTKSQGFMSGVNRGLNFFVGQVKDTFGLGSGYAGQTGRITSQVDTQLDSLARKIMQTARAGVEGRIFALDVNNLQAEVDKFKPGAFKTDNAARDQLVTIRNNLAMMYSDTVSILEEPGNYSKDMVQRARKRQKEVGQLIAEATAAIGIYDRFTTKDPLTEAIINRSSGMTSNLPRLSEGVPPQ